VPATDTGRVDLAALMARLGGHNEPVTSVLVEGGGRLAGSLVRAGLVHKYEWFLAPRLIGGDGFASMGLLGVGRPADGPQLRFEQVRSVGDDIHITAYPAHSTD
jgi:diaminohydroxyphosphoribosylaminopyrimidine deaminase/5-amino-6-(5-phosphoribosylamino)uracil reductase